MFWILKAPSRAKVWRDKVIWPLTNFSLPNSLVSNALYSLLHCPVSCLISPQLASSVLVQCRWPAILYPDLLVHVTYLVSYTNHYFSQTNLLVCAGLKPNSFPCYLFGGSHLNKLSCSG